jgi:hypothetical protein
MGRGAGNWAAALAADAVAVVLFAAGGRNAHDEGSGAGGLISTAAPFLVGVAVAWLASPSARRHPIVLRTGVTVWLAAVAVGMVLRRAVWDRGTALSFVVVATVVLGVLIVGWRAMWVFARRRRELPSAAPPSKAGR